MSVFEDLIDELKSENLLEETIIDPARKSLEAVGRVVRSTEAGPIANAGGLEPPVSGICLPEITEPANERDFYRKRAMEEVSSLQMVEHVLSGVERVHMKAVPAAFDDLKVKQALHKFLQVSEDLKSPKHAEAEYALRQETETWNFALCERDQKISVTNVRRFCEDSRPVLSSQALIALARFYRNSPYSEEVRGKFDYVVTRLFSRETGGEMREKLFDSADVIGHLKTLYANWSSVVLFNSEEDELEVTLTIARFEEFISEVELAGSFDELLRSDFFSRLRTYKEESAELFFVPEVVAAALRCNLAVGNRYVQLIGLERRKQSAEKIEEKYGVDYDEIVSNVSAKTITLKAIAGLEPEEEELQPGRPAAAQPTPEKKKQASAKRERDSEPAFDLFGVNRWLMFACIVCISLTAGLYVWAEKFAGGNESSAEIAAPVKFDDPEMAKFIRSPRMSKDTLYAVVTPEFDSLSEQERRDLVEKAHRFAGTRNLQKVNLLGSKGQSVAYASQDRLELVKE